MLFDLDTVRIEHEQLIQAPVAHLPLVELDTQPAQVLEHRGKTKR